VEVPRGGQPLPRLVLARSDAARKVRKVFIVCQNGRAYLAGGEREGEAWRANKTTRLELTGSGKKSKEEKIHTAQREEGQLIISFLLGGGLGESRGQLFSSSYCGR